MITPKENFEDFMNGDIGQVTDAWSPYIVDTRKLPNGNTEKNMITPTVEVHAFFFGNLTRKLIGLSHGVPKVTTPDVR